MGRLGISLYPEHSTFEKDKAYLDLAHKYGYTRVFTSLLQINGDQDAVVANFKKIVQYAKSLDFKVMVDMNPSLFKQLGITYDDLSFFDDLGAWGLRLDEGFTGMEEARMTRNPYGIKIEVNMSNGTRYLENILSFAPDKQNLLGCHNFYPQEYTGLGENFFVKCSKLFRENNINTAAFVSSKAAGFGPWPVQDGLPTIEDDRHLPIDTQVQHLLLTGLIDDVLIGNAYASEDELKTASKAFFGRYPVLHANFVDDLTENEKLVALGKPHLYRGDASDYLLRDTMPRVWYKDKEIPAHHELEDFKRGDIIVVNDVYSRYKGELQIALKAFPNDGRRNVVGHLTDDDLFLLDYIKPWSTFELK
ncbi:Outer surface protein of unknown function, cellobiose operon [Pediococcus damnosus]|uniref:Outer surface protein n=1 Tax=Pediococcus damnosus TaxID=51663 RepID=A0ABN4N7Y4_9LACO|nr:MupG family TIM beta-alpha barrel fold protein [Pediococcus damnosus]AMV66760.1 Outer surface protein of unknown function, cellobiose operon [Pediococcus damnosus]